MSICVSVKVAEGLVLAADSTSTIIGELEDQAGNKQVGVLQTFQNASKITQIKDYPIGVMSWGIGAVGGRSLESLVAEFGNNLPMRENTPTFSVDDLANRLFRSIMDQYEKAHPDASGERPILGLFIGGYSTGRFFPDLRGVTIPHESRLVEIIPDPPGKHRFGAAWFGLTDAIVRFHWGRDDALQGVLKDTGKFDDAQTSKIMSQFQYPVIFDGMPLQDAIDYAEFLVSIVIGRFRFCIGPALCGGDIEVAAITAQRGFEWIMRKSLKAR